MVDSHELQRWFDNLRQTLEDSYTTCPDTQPWRQSGMSGPQERWVSLRRPLVDCLHRSGTFLDIGCANGYLLECLLGWASEGGLQVDPYGLDISTRLVEMARRRLPRYAGHFFVANAFDWIPPLRSDFVRTELVYVPAEYERAFVERLFAHYLKPDGRLIVASYMEGLSDPERGCVPGCFATADILGHLADLHIHPSEHHDGYDPLKGRRTRFAVLTRQSLE
jgi:SAM-dependent methyltransferase